MKHHIIRLIVLIAMAVYALAFCTIIHRNLVVEDLCLFKRGDITLCNLHKAPRNVCRLYETIRNIFINRLFSHLYLKSLE